MALKVKPLGDRVLVEPVEEKEEKKGGIIIPDSAKEKPTEGLIVALGTGKTGDDGKKIPFEVKKGDRVLISKYGGTRRFHLANRTSTVSCPSGSRTTQARSAPSNTCVGR